MPPDTGASILHADTIVQGPLFPEPVQVLLAVPMGAMVKLVGKGLRTSQVYEPVLSPEQIASLSVSPSQPRFDGDATRFRLGVEALRLGLAYEYDPFFSLSVARIDPLPHQLEAVYDYFLKLPRIRFLLADDPGAGKTIMAGLLIKELKIRGLIRRILVVAPANLTFQWQRELKDKFHEQFEVIRGDVLRANYGSNPWQERNQVITSVSWVSRIEDAKESLLRSRWDLIVVDEAHKMSAYSESKKTQAYQLGEALSERTDHYLLMTATPHKGDPDNFRLFLRLLDKDVYADNASLQEAIRRNEAPFYLRRVKEALVTFPDPDTGQARTLFTQREVQTVEFHLDYDEAEFYEDLTRFVEDQSIRAAMDDSARGRALGFTMAMLQRRFASSVHAVRRSLERMKERREKILADPAAHRQQQILRHLPDEYIDLPEDEQQALLEEAEQVVASVDPTALREEVVQLASLIRQAHLLEQREVESKLIKLKEVLTQQGLFLDTKMKLLLFTEHKDTLDYLVGKLQEWGLTITFIHGGMKIGDRDQPGTRLYAERAFRDEAQVLVATEAAGEGINLQFCWFMINYDIPWNPMRLEQRMGRIHRYGQDRDCLVLNFVSTNTREGRVLQKLFERLGQIEADLDPRRTGKVFNVLGDIFPSNELERMLRDMYARNASESVIIGRIVEQVDTARFRRITNSTLEGLAKRSLNLSSIVGRSEEAKERRLVPEVVEGFFLQAAPALGLQPREVRGQKHLYQIGRVPRTLWSLGERLEPRFGRLGREYRQTAFDKELLKRDPTLEWVTPGHPLFEVVREATWEQAQDDLQRGAVFYDLQRSDPVRLDIYTAAIRDGRGNTLEQRAYVIETNSIGQPTVRQPTLLLDLIPAPKGTGLPAEAAASSWPRPEETERALVEQALQPLLAEVQARHAHEIESISHHLEISLNALIDRQQLRMAELFEQQSTHVGAPLLAANMATVSERLDELNMRLEQRRAELEQEGQCTIAGIRHNGCAWVLPHPQRMEPVVADMIQDPEIERIAVQAVTTYEEARGWRVQSVEKDNKGFDLISRKPHPDDPQTAIEVRFIEVKGRAGVGEVALTANEYETARRLTSDYWLYVVYNCSSLPTVHIIDDPARLGWEPIRMVEHYRIRAQEILEAER